VNYDRFYKNYITLINLNSLTFVVSGKLSPYLLNKVPATINSQLKFDNTYPNLVNPIKQIKMKNSEIEKPKFAIRDDDSDYISDSMMIQNNQNKSKDIDKLLLNENTIEDSEENRNFDLFAHILEG
jgi:hypothetical protein